MLYLEDCFKDIYKVRYSEAIRVSQGISQNFIHGGARDRRSSHPEALGMFQNLGNANEGIK